MIPFISGYDLWFAAAGVGGLLLLAAGVFWVARAQQPAQRLDISPPVVPRSETPAPVEGLSSTPPG